MGPRRTCPTKAAIGRRLAKRHTVATPNTDTATDVILHGNAADEAESHPAKASRAPQRDGGDKSTGSEPPEARRQRRHVEPRRRREGATRRAQVQVRRENKTSGVQKMRTNTDDAEQTDAAATRTDDAQLEQSEHRQNMPCWFHEVNDKMLAIHLDKLC